jgi:hypothetical protein
MLRPLALAVACLAATPAVAAAEWHFVPMVGVTFRGSTTLVDVEHATDKAHINLGGAVTLLGRGVLGVETVFVFTPGFFDRDGASLIESSSTYALMGNAVLTLPQRWTEYSLRPFVSGGLGWTHASTTLKDDALSLGVDTTGFNIGGGAVGFMSKRTGVRFDLRYYHTLRRTDKGPVALGKTRLGYVSGSIGIVFRR